MNRRGASAGRDRPCGRGAGRRGRERSPARGRRHGRCIAQARGPARRRLRHDAPGADAPLLARDQGRPRPRSAACGRTWCWSTAAMASCRPRSTCSASSASTMSPVAAIAKGPDRNAGRERFFLPGREPFLLDPKNPVLYFLQRLRDEAHRFVIGAHRAKRSSLIGKSELDQIAGHRRQAQEGAAAAFRLGTRGCARGSFGPVRRRGHQRNRGEEDLRSLPRRLMEPKPNAGI